MASHRNLARALLPMPCRRRLAAPAKLAAVVFAAILLAGCIVEQPTPAAGVETTAAFGEVVLKEEVVQGSYLFGLGAEVGPLAGCEGGALGATPHPTTAAFEVPPGASALHVDLNATGIGVATALRICIRDAAGSIFTTAGQPPLALVIEPAAEGEAIVAVFPSNSPSAAFGPLEWTATLRAVGDTSGTPRTATS